MHRFAPSPPKYTIKAAEQSARVRRSPIAALIGALGCVHSLDTATANLKCSISREVIGQMKAAQDGAPILIRTPGCEYRRRVRKVILHQARTAALAMLDGLREFDQMAQLHLAIDLLARDHAHAQEMLAALPLMLSLKWPGRQTHYLYDCKTHYWAAPDARRNIAAYVCRSKATGGWCCHLEFRMQVPGVLRSNCVRSIADIGKFDPLACFMRNIHFEVVADPRGLDACCARHINQVAVRRHNSRKGRSVAFEEAEYRARLRHDAEIELGHRVSRWSGLPAHTLRRLFGQCVGRHLRKLRPELLAANSPAAIIKGHEPVSPLSHNDKFAFLPHTRKPKALTAEVIDKAISKGYEKPTTRTAIRGHQPRHIGESSRQVIVKRFIAPSADHRPIKRFLLPALVA